MNELLNKLSSYNLLNYLIPGVIFVILSKEVTGYNFIQQDIILGLFFYYFIGLIISRIGSLVIEPFLKWTGFVHFADYKDYVKASKNDEKIEILSEENNVYRTLGAMVFSVLILMFQEWIINKWLWFGEWREIILVIFLLIMFLFAYRKQTKYVKERIEMNR